MMTLDVKTVPWVGAICQRFEALCEEVDETTYEDTAKYVGNQMRTVGDTFKKFYSEVMQDLLPLSSPDLVKDNDTLVAVPHDADAAISAKPKIDEETESESDDDAVEGMVKDKNTVNNARDSDLTSSRASIMKDPREKPTCSGSCREWSEAFECHDLIFEEASPVEEGQSKESSEEITGDIMERNASAVIEGSPATMISVRDVSTEIKDPVSTIESAVGTTITSNVRTCLDFNENITVSDAGASNALLAHKISSEDAHMHQQGVHVSEQCNNFKLEESCVLVEYKNHFSKPSLGDLQKSYKKKIRDAFTSRRWSKSKKDQYQLAAWYEEQCGKMSVSTPTRHDEFPTAQISETFESEWELI